MDLEALSPEEPQPSPPAPDAPPMAWAPAPWEAPEGSPWAGPQEADAGRSEAGPPGPAAWVPGGVVEAVAAERLGLSRPTKVLAGAIAVAVIAAGAWAAGSAIHGSGPSVRFTPASATAAGSTGSSGATPATPHARRNLGGGGVVSGVDAAGDTITVTLPARHSTSTTPGAAPVAPATTSATIKVTSATVFYVTKSGTAADITTGMRLAATGTANADDTLTATTVTLLASGLAPSAPKPPAAAVPNAPAVPKGPANPPVASGTVTSVTTSGGDTTLVVTGPRGARTVIVTPTTTITETIKGGLSDVGVGDMVLARGHRNSDGSVDAAVVVDVAAGLKGVGRNGLGFGFGRGFGPGRFFPGGRGGPGGPFGHPAPAASTSSSPV